MTEFKTTLWILGIILIFDLLLPYLQKRTTFKLFGDNSFLHKLLSHSTAFITLLSFYFAIVALNETKESGEEQNKVLSKQNKALDESRVALQEMVLLTREERKALTQSGITLNTIANSANKQQNVLGKQLTISGRHLEFIVQQNNRKPSLIFNFGNVEESRIKTSDTLLIFKKADGTYGVQIAVKNIGDTIAYNPVLIAVVEPKTVIVQEKRYTFEPERPHYMASKSFFSEGINRFSLSGQDVVYDLRFTPPAGVQVFTVDFRLVMSNGPAHSRKVICRVKP